MSVYGTLAAVCEHVMCPADVLVLHSLQTGRCLLYCAGTNAAPQAVKGPGHLLNTHPLRPHAGHKLASGPTLPCRPCLATMICSGLIWFVRSQLPHCGTSGSVQNLATAPAWWDGFSSPCPKVLATTVLTLSCWWSPTEATQRAQRTLTTGPAR